MTAPTPTNNGLPEGCHETGFFSPQNGLLYGTRGVSSLPNDVIEVEILPPGSRERLAEALAILHDPAALHLNIQRGTIARPGVYDEADRMRERLRDLEAALKPFAEIEFDVHGSQMKGESGTWECFVDVADIVRARALSKETP